jgi:pyruvate/2-oxoglutarate dehydrogenase complex dihydrolipoamide acyltransferase (E2) component
MKITLKLVRVGMNMQEATIAQWLKAPGDSFVEGDPLYAIETEKVTQDVLATASGTLLEVLVPAGQEARVGEGVCVVEFGSKT